MTLFSTGAILAFLGVAAGAFGAHGLKDWFHSVPELLPIYQTAVQYQMYHSIGILLASTRAKPPLRAARWAGYCFIAGILIFSGSLYAIALDAPKKLGMITPIGGVAFLSGWILLAVSAWGEEKRDPD